MVQLELGITRLMDVEDMAEPDEKSVMAYIGVIFQQVTYRDSHFYTFERLMCHF